MNENPKKLKCFEASPVPGYVAANHPQQILKRCPLNDITNTSTKRQRQSSCKARDSIISKYKLDVSLVWDDRPSQCNPWFKPDGFTLDCKSINPEKLPIGFTQASKDRFQYNFTDPVKQEGTKRYRPVAYRMPFLKHHGFYDKNLTVSHLCHNNWCYNWNHHVFESLEINKARNGCPSGPSCRHKIKCLIPGIYSEN